MYLPVVKTFVDLVLERTHGHGLNEIFLNDRRIIQGGQDGREEFADGGGFVQGSRVQGLQ